MDLSRDRTPRVVRAVFVSSHDLLSACSPRKRPIRGPRAVRL